MVLTLLLLAAGPVDGAEEEAEAEITGETGVERVDSPSGDSSSERIGPGPRDSAARSLEAAELERRIDDLERKVDETKTAYRELSERSKKLTNVPIFLRADTRELDFEKEHIDMLKRYSEVVRVTIKIAENESQMREYLNELDLIHINQLRIAPGIRTKLGELQRKSKALLDLIETDRIRTEEYRDRMNSALIEEVHKYQIKLSFRKLVGLWWAVGFVLILCAFLLVFYIILKRSGGKETPKVEQMARLFGSNGALRLIAVVMIIYVVLLFGVTDVIGENGVTGILAAIAGYILGSSNENLAEVVKAVRGDGGKDDKQGDE